MSVWKSKRSALKKLRTRKGLAIWSILISVLLSLAFGAVFALVTLKPQEIIRTSLVCFGMFFAFGAVAGVLLLVTKISDDYALGYGAGLYYGTVFCGMAIKGIYHTSNAASFELAFIIVALVCYIICIKMGHGKKDEENKE